MLREVVSTQQELSNSELQGDPSSRSKPLSHLHLAEVLLHCVQRVVDARRVRPRPPQCDRVEPHPVQKLCVAVILKTETQRFTISSKHRAEHVRAASLSSSSASRWLGAMNLFQSWVPGFTKRMTCSAPTTAREYDNAVLLMVVTKMEPPGWKTPNVSK